MKYKVGDVVTLDLPEGTYYPLKAWPRGGAIFGGLIYPAHSSFTSVNNMDKITIVEIINYDSIILGKLGLLPETYSIPKNKIATNGSKLKRRLGVE